MGLDPCTECPELDPWGHPDAANFRFGLKYDSQDGSPSGDGPYFTPAGRGWTHSYHMTAKPGDGDEILVTRGTRTDHYAPDANGVYVNDAGFYNQGFLLPDGAFELHWPDQTVERYENGRIAEIRNKTGQRLGFQYTGGVLSTVIDPLGRAITYSYEDGMLDKITDFTGRVVDLDHNEAGELVSLTGPAVVGTPNGNDFPFGKRMRFEYESGRLARIFAPNESAGGPPKIQVAYNGDARVSTLTVGGTNASGVAAGGSIGFAYAEAGANFQTTVTDRNTNVTRYETNPKHNIVEVREFTKGLRAGEPGFFKTTCEYNTDGERTEMELPEGNLHTWEYDVANPDRAAHGNVLFYTRFPDARGGDQAFLRREVMYEPIYQQACLVVEERGLDPAYVPQNGGAATAARYTTRWRFDYQEGSDVAALAAARNLPESFVQSLLDAMAAEIPLGLGDLNGDGVTSETAGNAIQKIFPTAKLADGTSQPMTEEYGYNQFGQRVFVVDREKNRDVYDYYPSEDPNGDGLALIAATPTGLGYLQRVLYDAAVLAIDNTFFYDEVGNVTADRDGRGNKKTQHVNALNQVVRTVSESPFLHIVDIERDANNNPISRTIQNKDENLAVLSPFVHVYKFDILDDMVAEDLDAAGSNPNRLVTQRRFDANENLVLLIHPVGNRTTMVFDERDLLFERTRGAGSADAATYTYNYDRNRNQTEMLDAEDTDGADGRERWKTRYDGFDRPREREDAKGNITTTTYDPASNPVRVEHFGHPAGSGANVLLAESLQKFDELSRTFERGRKLFAGSGGQPVGAVSLVDGPTGEPGFVSAQTIFDRLDRVVRTIDDEGDLMRTEFDGVDRAVRRVDALDNEVLSEYDDNHNPVKITEIEKQPEGMLAPEAFVTVLVYDEVDRQIAAQDPLKHTRRTRYDSRSNMTRTSDAEDGFSADGAVNADGNTVRHVYDGVNRMLATHRDLRVGGKGSGGIDTTNPFNPDGVVSTFQSWDVNSRLRTQTDDNGNTTTYGYNERDVKTSDKFADGTSNTYIRDLDDNVKTFIDENGSVFGNTYDALNRKTFCGIQRAPGVVGTTQQSWVYDGLSRLRGHTDDNDPADGGDDGVCDLVLDSLSRSIEEQQNGRVISASWFGASRRTKVVYPGGRQIGYTHDGLDRIKTVSDLATYRYVGPARFLARELSNGTRLDIGYDADRRATSWVHTRSGQTIVGFTYGYNREDNPTFEFRLHEGDGDSFAYDSLYRVTSTSFDDGKFDAFYTLDGVHNWRGFARTKEGETLFDATNTVNEMNEYVGFGNSTERHDDNGNLTVQTILKENGKIDLVRRFEWDALNRLSRVTEQPEGKGPQRLVATYAYYADNRRVHKRVFGSSGQGNPHVEETQFYYDGWRTIEEQAANGATLATYVSGPMYIDEHIAMDRRQGNSNQFRRFFYHANRLFSVHGLTNEAGELVEAVRYDIYGRPFINRDEVDFKKQAVDDKPPKESPKGNPFLFTGHRFDAESGNYWMRHRYLTPAFGRFTTRDPLQLLLDGLRYSYASSSPALLLDALGLQEEWM